MLNDLRLRLRALFRRKAVEVEMDEELRFHFENQVAKLMRSGWTPAEAQRRARLEFGGMEQIKEEYREARGVSFIGTFVQDIRFGLRILGRTPVITCVAVVSLARSGNDRGSHWPVIRGCASGGLSPGTPRHARRSHRRAAVRINHAALGVHPAVGSGASIFCCDRRPLS